MPVSECLPLYRTGFVQAEWTHRVDLERRNGNLTALMRDVLLVLFRLMQLGDDSPSEARLMSEAGASRATVQRAKARGRELGLLAWDRNWRIVGRLREEKPCTYRAAMPLTPVSRREHQAEARKGSKQIQEPTRSVHQQLKALPPNTDAILALQTAHKARVRASLCRRPASERG